MSERRFALIEQRLDAIEEAMGALEGGSWRHGYYPVWPDFAAKLKAKEKPTPVKEPASDPGAVHLGPHSCAPYGRCLPGCFNGND